MKKPSCDLHLVTPNDMKNGPTGPFANEGVINSEKIHINTQESKPTYNSHRLKIAVVVVELQAVKVKKGVKTQKHSYPGMGTPDRCYHAMVLLSISKGGLKFTLIIVYIL